VWGYKPRELTRFNFIQIGRVFVPVIGLYDTGAVPVPAGRTIDFTLPDGVLLSFFLSADAYITIYLNDGVRVSTFPHVTSATTDTTLIPLMGGWALRATNTATVTKYFRMKALVLDPDVVSVFGGNYQLPDFSERTVCFTDPGDGKYRVFMYGLTSGDGMHDSAIILFRMFEIITLASGKGLVKWAGVRDDFHAVGIDNKYVYTANHTLIGLEVKI
jgi:hypothetical protein